jgi:hypothetical protein
MRNPAMRHQVHQGFLQRTQAGCTPTSERALDQRFIGALAGSKPAKYLDDSRRLLAQNQDSTARTMNT